MRYYANPSTPAIRAAMSAGELAAILTPRQRLTLPGGAAWCADNGCYGTGYPGDEAWIAWLDSYPHEARSRCAFATAPDVVGDAAATLERSLPWLPHIRKLGYPAALVAQDGLEDLTVPWGAFDVLFIGGSTEWKLGPAARDLVAQAVMRGVPVHMGRVNSGKRMRYADAIGCTSSDGTFLTFAPDANLPRVRSWLASVNAPSLADA